MIDVSFSALRDYQLCPFLYKQKHRERVKSDGRDDRRGFLGVLLQKLVEEFYVEEWWRHDAVALTMEVRAAELLRMMSDGSAIVWSDTERARLDRQIAEAIPTILETIRRERLVTSKVYPEFELFMDFTVRKEDVRVHGRADFIIEDYGPLKWLIVLDGKAGSSHAPLDQLRFYSMALPTTPAFRRLPDAAGFWWFRRGEVSWKPVTAVGMAACCETILATLDELLEEKNRYPPTPGPGCRDCGWRSGCPEGRAYLLTKTSKVAIDGGNIGLVSL